MPKRIVFTQGGKGGVGKTTAALSLFDYYQTKAAAVTLADFDGENRAKSGLNFWHKSADKVDIHTRSGLDKLIDSRAQFRATTSFSQTWEQAAERSPISGSPTVYPDLAAEGVKFTSIGMSTADPEAWKALSLGRSTLATMFNT